MVELLKKQRFFKQIVNASRSRRGQTSVHDRRGVARLKLGVRIAMVRKAKISRCGPAPNRSNAKQGWSRTAYLPQKSLRAALGCRPPLQVELSSACCVASLGQLSSHYLPGHLCLRPCVLGDHLFGWGVPSTRQARSAWSSPAQAWRSNSDQ